MKNLKESDFATAEERIRKHLVAQFKDQTAQQELRKMGPGDINWIERTSETLNLLIPQLPKLAVHLVEHVPKRLNSAATASDLASLAPKHLQETAGLGVKVPPEAMKWAAALRDATDTSRTLISNIDSQHVSAEIQRQTVAFFGGVMRANGGSLYPDLLLVNRKYQTLPPQKRGKGQQVDGPCLRGEHVSNVPDGMEIKANEGYRIKVDAHAAHAGLHFGVTWECQNERVSINGIWAAYVRFADHSAPVRNVPTTTLKYSFGHDLFISVLP